MCMLFFRVEEGFYFERRGGLEEVVVYKEDLSMGFFFFKRD